MTENRVDRLHYKKMLIRIIYLWIFLFIMAIFTIITIYITHNALNRERDAFYKEAQLFKFVSNYQAKFSYSTVQIRSFLITGQPLFFANYLRTSIQLKQLNNTLKFFQDLDATQDEINLLDQIKRTSEEINISETHALKLLSKAYSVSSELLTDEINSYALTSEETAKSGEDQLRLAEGLLFDASYLRQNAKVTDLLDQFQSKVQYRLKHDSGHEIHVTNWSLWVLTVLLILQALAIGAVIWLRAVSLKKYIRR